VLSDPLRSVEVQLREAVGGVHGVVGDTAMSLVETGGKRLRPALVVASAIATRGPGAVTGLVIEAAAAVELLHLASLCHDDVLDCAEVRRGHASANVSWGNRVAVLAGDVLLSRAFCIVSELRSRERARFCQTVEVMCAGQVAETHMQFERSASVPGYQSAIRGKTGALFASSCWLGASAADASESLLSALERYGGELGTAFQMLDDVHDLRADGAETGKPCAADLRAGVVTLPALLALHDDPGLGELLGSDLDEQEIDEVRCRVLATRGGVRTLEIARGHVERALSSLSEVGLFPEGKAPLVSIAESVRQPVGLAGVA
jgi:heptaprenyl diphosphate synthase